MKCYSFTSVLRSPYFEGVLCESCFVKDSEAASSPEFVGQRQVVNL
jgi:hypothetical protein